MRGSFLLLDRSSPRSAKRGAKRADKFSLEHMFNNDIEIPSMLSVYGHGRDDYDW